MFLADTDGFSVPDAGLDLTDVSATHHKHAKTRLTDTAANGKRKLIIEKHPVEGEGATVITARERQLTVERFTVNTDSHRGDLKGAVKHLVPEEKVAVELPVIVVGSASVVGLSALQLSGTV